MAISMRKASVRSQNTAARASAAPCGLPAERVRQEAITSAEEGEERRDALVKVNCFGICVYSTEGIY